MDQYIWNNFFLFIQIPPGVWRYKIPWVTIPIQQHRGSHICNVRSCAAADCQVVFTIPPAILDLYLWAWKLCQVIWMCGLLNITKTNSINIPLQLSFMCYVIVAFFLTKPLCHTFLYNFTFWIKKSAHFGHCSTHRAKHDKLVTFSDGN